MKWGYGTDRSGRRSLDFTLPLITSQSHEAESRRRTARVAVVVPIVVTGRDANDEAFEEETHTTGLSGYGASIVLSRQLKPQQEIVIARQNSSAKATCRVAYERGGQEHGHLYGVAFVDPAVDLWGVRDLLTEAQSAAQLKPA